MNDKKSSIVDPLVKVEVLGVPADCTEKETRHIVNNGTVLGSGRFLQKLCTFGSVSVH